MGERLPYKDEIRLEKVGRSRAWRVHLVLYAIGLFYVAFALTFQWEHVIARILTPLFATAAVLLATLAVTD